jgi:colanic acid/amylovoran biosynthesis glycosyltransferase
VHEDVVRYGLTGRTVYYGNGDGHVPAKRIPRIRKALDVLKGHFAENPAAFLHSMNFIKYKREAVTLRTMLKMAPFLGKDDYDVVHCHFGPNGNLGVSLKELGVFRGKILTAFHGYDVSQYVRKHGAGIYDRLFRIGDLFQPISDMWKRELISMGCSREKIGVHHMGIDPEKYHFSRRTREGKDAIKVLSIGRFVEKKGFPQGIAAVGRVMKEYRDLEYRIIGDGDLRKEIEAEVARSGFGDRIALLGWKSQEEILSFMGEADILLAPSLTSKDGDQEGIPVVLMEAMAMGIPVVSTFHSGIPELVQDNVSGFLAPEGDVEALAEKLDLCLESRDRWHEIGMAGRKTVTENFNIHRLNDRLVETYRRLVGR